MMETKKMIRSKRGLEARPAALIATRAGRFKATIKIGHGSRWVNAKSVMGMMLLAAPHGSTMTIQAEGEDEHLAVEELSSLFDVSLGTTI